MRDFPIITSPQEVPSLFFRPPLQLRSLPIKSRWEATRRHPLYYVFWKIGDMSFALEQIGDIEGETDAAAIQKAIDKNRLIYLNAIGVNPEMTVDPATDFSEMGEMEKAWYSGVVHPTSLRGLATLLVGILPKETLASLGMAFIEASRDDEAGDDPEKIKALNKIGAMDHDSLNFLTPEPYICINPEASARQARTEIGVLLKKWKQQLGSDEYRVRGEKHSDYFDVWDRREGFCEGRYVSGKGRQFAEIAQALEKPLTTIHSQYKSAFQLITGHDYRIDKFLTLFGKIRFSALFATDSDLKYRRLQASTRNPVPESRLGASASDVAADKERMESDLTTYSLRDLVKDYQVLSEQGLSDKEAAEKLGVKDFVKFQQFIELREI